jgi:hypothetical protein
MAKSSFFVDAMFFFYPERFEKGFRQQGCMTRMTSDIMVRCCCCLYYISCCGDGKTDWLPSSLRSRIYNEHSWASASRSMPPASASRSKPPASAIRHPVSQSGTGQGPLILVPDWFRHRNFCSFRYRTDWMPDSPTVRQSGI